MDVESGIHRHGIRNPQRGIRNPRLSWITLHGANNSVFLPIQQARYIDVSISEFQKHAFESFLALMMFLDISFTIL